MDPVLETLGAAMLAMDREAAMVASLTALIVAGAAVAVGAVLLLWRELARR